MATVCRDHVFTWFWHSLKSLKPCTIFLIIGSFGLKLKYSSLMHRRGVCVTMCIALHQTLWGMKGVASWIGAGLLLIVSLLAVSGASRDPAIAFSPGRPARFGERLLVRVLLGMNLIVEEISRQLIAVIDLHLRGKTRWDLRHTCRFSSDIMTKNLSMHHKSRKDSASIRRFC